MGVMDTSVAFLTDEDGKPERHPLNEFYRTPAMERLAEQGVRFNQFCAMSVCSPTRISIMTGQNAARHHATNWINPTKDNAGTHGAVAWNWAGLRKGDVTLPGLLREGSYRTIHVGKAHFGPMEHDGEEPLNLGFDVNVAGHSWGAPSSYYGEKNYGHGTERDRNAVPHLEHYHGTDTFLSEALTLEAKKQVAEAAQSDQPFFLHFSHYAVHSPFDSDPRFAANYKDSGKPPAAQAFATLIEGIDKSLGDMLDQLEELGIAENTLVLFLGDNGTDAPLGNPHEIACAAPLRGKKGAHYEGGMRVPFIAAWAATDPANPWQKRLPIAAGTLQSQVANVTDLFPTLLALADVESPSEHRVDGNSLATLFTGAADANRPQQFLMHYPHGPHRSSYFTSWRDGDWKLIYHYHAPVGKRCELFNLAQDPCESRNLTAEKPAECRRLLNGMVAALEDAGAQYPRALADGETLQRPELCDL
jgi:arylsulfatase A-like enzyme